MKLLNCAPTFRANRQFFSSCYAFDILFFFEYLNVEKKLCISNVA